MTVINTRQLAPARRGLEDRMGIRKTKTYYKDGNLRIRCAEESAFEIDLILRDADGKMAREEIWERFSLEEGTLEIQTEDERRVVHFREADCEIRLKDYAFAPYAFAPGHYVQSGWAQLRKALEKKQELLPEHLSEREKEALAILEEETAAEDRAGVERLEKLREALAEKEEKSEAEEKIRKLMAKSGAAEAYPRYELAFRPAKKRISVGWKTYSCSRKSLRCLTDFRISDGRIIVRCGVTDRAEIVSPAECAVPGDGIRIFKLYVADAALIDEETLAGILDHAMLGEGENPQLFSPWQKRSPLPVFLFSGVLWGGILAGLYRFAMFLFSFAKISLPDWSLWFFAAPLLYGLILLWRYESSVKR